MAVPTMTLNQNTELYSRCPGCFMLVRATVKPLFCSVMAICGKMVIMAIMP